MKWALRNNHGLSKSNVNNDSSKQEQVGTQTLCFNGGEFEQSSTHAQGILLLKELQQQMLEPCA